jgi:hypothetical protein
MDAKTKKAIRELIELGMSAAEAYDRVVGPQASALAGAVAVPATEAPKAPRARKANDFHEKVIKARVGCAYGSKSCEKQHFAPNGVGSKQHTTCPKGRAALKAARQ